MNEFEIAIKEHLDKVALSDPAFAEKYLQKCNSEEESISKCCGYIISEVQKLKRSAMADSEVFGMAMHYYDENIVFDGNVPQCNVVVSKENFTEEDKERIRKRALEELEAEAVEEYKRKFEAEKRKAEDAEKKRKEEIEKKRKEQIAKKKEEFESGGLLFGFDEE